MKRVVITGMGIISSLGLGKDAVLNALKNNTSGIKFNPKYEELGFRSQVSGELPEFDYKEIIDRKMARFMADAAIYSAVAMDEAIKDADLTVEQISNPRTGIITG
jgi:3-oxoacyl-[acyl-carrier-protein] synthase-1